MATGNKKGKRSPEAKSQEKREVLGTEVVNLAEVWMGNLGSYWGEEVTICYLVPTFLYR